MADTLLCIDTSTNLGSVCLRHKGRTESIDISKPNAQAAALVPAIESLLNAHGIWYNDLDALATTIGPGSFTGLRIGLAAARTIAFMHPGLTLYPFTTLECLAAGYEGDSSSLYATLKAGKGEIYAQWFERINGKIVPTGHIEIINPTAAPHPNPLPLGEGSARSAHANGTPSPSGEGWGEGQAQSVIIGNTHELTQWELYTAPDYPHARDLLRAVDSIALTESRTLKPLYIRPPDAKLPGGEDVKS
jgi:tRNA threonylcarbamoyl adenosine modification protein YeaZ